jgi:predicted ATPase/DNA-binding winged helix-turn-helix (wHTH) protein
VTSGTTTDPLRDTQIDVASFGPFQLYPSARTLEKAGTPLVLGNRALDILMALVEEAGQVVSHKALMARAWRGLVVDPSNLRVHVSSLRKALGDIEDRPRYIANVAGQGYCFVAPVTRGPAGRVPARAPDYPSGAARRRLVLPAKLERMVGREDALRIVAADLIAERFVSIIGPGGMGKTTVAVAVAHMMLEEFADAVCFVDVGMVADPALLVTTIASTLGLTIQTDDALATLLECLRTLRVLLVLDNCEHVIDAAATLAEQIFEAAPAAHILATSREALRVEGEHVYCLPPLASPPPNSSMSAADVLEFPAVKLFSERAAASGKPLNPSDADAAVIAGIVGRLDGIALAIELTAGRVATHGLRGTADLLEKGLGLHWQGRRTAHPRHQTLQALLDWSYGYLSVDEQVVLRRLAVLVGPFAIETAQAIACDDDRDEEQLVDVLDHLVEKSLISSATEGTVTRYRLLETTRVYGAKKLEESGERHAIARRHATYFARALHLVHGVHIGFSRNGRPLSLNDYLGNARSALAWCFEGTERGSAVTMEPNRARLCIDIAAASIPLFLELSLLTECLQWTVKALALLDDATRGSKREMALQEAKAITAMWTRGNGDDVRDAIARGLEIARQRGETSSVLRLLVGWHMFFFRIGDFRSSRSVAEELAAVAASRADESYMVIANWLRGGSDHFIGDQAAARRCFEAAFSNPVPRDLELFGLDCRVRALVPYARVLWLTGSPDRAAATARQAIGEAARLSKPVNVCFSLIYTAPVFIWCGDYRSASAVLEQLTAHPNWRALPSLHATALALQGELLLHRGELQQGIASLTPALRSMRSARQNILRTHAAGALAAALADVGRLDEAHWVLDEAMAELPPGEEPLDLPELLRIKSHVLLASGQPDEAESCLVRSLACARRQSALSWELRTAVSFARLRAQRGDSENARHELATVYNRFTEGFDTADLKAAKDLLAAIPSGAR